MVLLSIPAQLAIARGVDYELRAEDVVSRAASVAKGLAVVAGGLVVVVLVVVASLALLSLRQVVGRVHGVLVLLLAVVHRLVDLGRLVGGVGNVIVVVIVVVLLMGVLVVFLADLRRRLRCGLVLEDASLSHNPLSLLLSSLAGDYGAAPHEVQAIRVVVVVLLLILVQNQHLLRRANVLKGKLLSVKRSPAVHRGEHLLLLDRLLVGAKTRGLAVLVLTGDLVELVRY